ncbi:unnamed protein product [Colias eurytheme]|nr:unnamed protein product [Colias eurytheme]
MTVSEATNFVTKLKAHGSENDYYNLETACKDFTVLLTKLSTKDKQSFSLNVLCVLCRNLEKVPTWKQRINSTELITLCIECVRQNRGLEGEERVKSLACIYHVHKYIVRQSTSVPPELILKLSFMPFECDVNNLLKDYHKTYWSILVDRLTYIEKLKTKLAIKKLLPKFNDDLTKVITIYKDINDFCTNLLPIIVKKMYYIFGDATTDLNESYRKLFDAIATHANTIKECNDKQLTELYVRFNDCIYVVTENLSKIDFKNSPLEDIVRICISLLGHRADIFHCFQTFYLNSFLYIFSKRANNIDNVFKNLIVSCETTEKLGYKSLMYATYPFLNQMLRLWIESYEMNVSSMESSCLNFVLFLMGKAKKCSQLVKCENCNIKTGLHDALRLSFLVKNLINKAVNDNSFSSKSEVFHAIREQQYSILDELKAAGCVNISKYHVKLQTDVHNAAILLHKAGNYEFSITLFDIYLSKELENLKAGDFKNVSRGLYNKSICELDNKMYEGGIRDAFLSLAFSQDVKNEKYMNIVVSMKGKAAKVEDNDNQDLQFLSVLSACETREGGVDIKPFLKHVKFSELLKHEFAMYEKLWPSLAPITGVILSLYKMVNSNRFLGCAEDKKAIKDTFYDIILKTPSIVKWIQNDRYKEIVKEIINDMDWKKLTLEDKMVYVALLFIKSEHDLLDASEKYGWKPAEQLLDLDKSVVVLRTLSQEHTATKDSIRGVELLASFIRDLGDVPHHRLAHFLRICEVIVQQLLHVHRTVHALQLANMCLRLSKFLGDKVAYIRNVGTILYHAERQYPEIDSISVNAVQLWTSIVGTKESMETALVFICEVAIYYIKSKRHTAAAILLRTAQAHIVNAMKLYPDMQLDLALGRLMEAQVLLCPDSGFNSLTAVNAIQRHYLATATVGTVWTTKRRNNLLLKYNTCLATEKCVKLCKYLKLWRRAKTAGGAGLGASGGKGQGVIYGAVTQTCWPEDAQVKINNALKNILDTTDIHITNIDLNKKIQSFTPKHDHIETMRDTMIRTQLSPSLPCISVPAFITPEFLKHDACSCYACVMPACAILSSQISSLEASMYFRSKEDVIARNYFNGALKTFELAEAKLKSIFVDNAKKFEKYIVNLVKDSCFKEFRELEVEFLIELAFFELSEKNFEKADDCIVRIHEILSENDIDVYLQNEISNLLVSSALLREKRPEIPKELDIDFDSLKISTNQEAKTPEGKTLPIDTVKLVQKEEIPIKRKVAKKINLDDPEEEPKIEKPKSKFKIPEPVIPKPSLEIITPRPTRSRPNIVITQADTPKTEQFFTPKSTPNEAFFTPQTSHKTYSRKIVKNLEAEFLTPIGTPSEITKKKDTKSLRKKTLLRATSPGKLEDKNKPVTRTRRVKQPVFDK